MRPRLMNTKRLFPLAMLVLLAALICHVRAVHATPQDTSADLAEAKHLLDTYYGRRDNLRRAGQLLDKVLAADRRNAAAYVQAARLTVMGGHIVREEYKSNTIETYHALLDKALAIDPNNQKAHILKAEAYDKQGDFAREKSSLDRARTYGESDPWLWNGYGRYYRKIGDRETSRTYFAKVETLGPGTLPEHRKAYTSALQDLARFKDAGQDPERLKSLAAAARRERHPDDAWVLGDFADLFVYYCMFDEAIDYARESLRVMDFGVGRVSLATALYGKAAGIIVAKGPREEADRLIAEARSLGVGKEAVLRTLERTYFGDLLIPTLLTIVD